MIPVEYYSAVYYLTLSFAVVLMALPLLAHSSLKSYHSSTNDWNSGIILLICVLFIGLRDPWGSWMYLGDTGAYTRTFENITSEKLLDSKDYGFDLFMYLSAQVMSIQLVLFFMCIDICWIAIFSFS
ncbi:hypothetical protein [Sphingobacterium sp. T2]|uniref:hypothetical protein n=1 Tax=Sphingobacterium sp. T2 TaxID=1590596 RepID=UPI00057B9E7C|nr:hypothetical protein [Sphingobacterium sp. T2]